MPYFIGERVFKRQLTRRDFLWLLSSTSAAVATPSIISGCAVNPVTGQQQLMLVSEEQEIAIDKENAPHQFSADYGITQDTALNNYLGEVGGRMANESHRPQMPYAFNVVNANYVNAYTFPAGSMGITRGILVELDNEAELAGLLGHELGHVNARHTAAQMSQGLLANSVLSGISAYVETTQYAGLSSIVEGLGGIGAGALLAKYSRDNERQADALGMEYMTQVGYPADGMTGLMEMLVEQSQHKPSAIEMMFATHPMSDERLENARQGASTTYQTAQGLPVQRERYMDNTSGVRRLKGAITTMQQGEGAMRQEAFNDAATQFSQALKQAPNDYTGLVLMARCQSALGSPQKAQQYAKKATAIYPAEAQAHQILGISELQRERPDAAHQAFVNYERVLPGNPNIVFLQGVALESMQNTTDAAQAYNRYLQVVQQGEQAQYAAQRLRDWGY